MPGRTSERTSASFIFPPSSNQRLASHRTAAFSTIKSPEDTPSSCLREEIGSVFNDVQKSKAGFRKLLVGLRKIQDTCVYEPTSSGKRSEKLFNEIDFNVEFVRIVVRIVSIKRSEGLGDRLVRFVGLFLRHASDKDAALASGTAVDEIGMFPENASTRLTSHILSILIQFLFSKEKTVRYRSTQLVAHIINSLDSIDDEYYHLLKMGLLKRVRDKESTIRVQAVLGLGRLTGNEDSGYQGNDESHYDDVDGLLEKLLDVLQHDPSADVRRSLLLNLPLTPSSLPFLLERARDVDAATRRALYSRLLPALGDFRHLSLSMREKLLRWGLRDRDENVRKATARLYQERWIEDCGGARAIVDDKSHPEAMTPNIDTLLELLERIDVINSGGENGIALEAMREFWCGRPDYEDIVSFDDLFWDNLSPESVFMARTFNDHYREKSGREYGSIVEEKMPEVTTLAYYLQRYTNELVQRLQRNSKRQDGEEGISTVEQEFIVEQLLHIAITLDYSDEVGRRKMFSLSREILAVVELPDEITKLVVDVLRELCGLDDAGERNFCSVVLEAIAEVHDAIITNEDLAANANESFHSAQSQLSDTTTPTKLRGRHYPSPESTDDQANEAKAIMEIVINMKCLHIAHCMLQNVEGILQQSMHLVTMLNNLVVPAVRSHEAPIRERGLLCLGLCCLLDKNLADENLTLFLHCFNKGHEALQVTAIHILTDLLIAHPSLLVAKEADVTMKKGVLRIFAKGVKAAYSPNVQSIATIALCKLMLTSVVHDEDLLMEIVVCYFDPAMKENAGVRQALNYFLPVYCYSHRGNMETMANVVVAVMQSLVNLSEVLEEGEDMIGLSDVGSILVDWTDPRKLVVPDVAAISWNEAGKKEVEAVSGDIHLDLANSLLQRVMSHGCPKDEKKALLGMLSKLYISSGSSVEKLQVTIILVVKAIEERVASDAMSRNTLNKLHSTLERAMNETGIMTKAQCKTRGPLIDKGLTSVEDHEAEESLLVAEREDIKMGTVIGNDGVEGLLDDDHNDQDF